MKRRDFLIQTAVVAAAPAFRTAGAFVPLRRESSSQLESAKLIWSAQQVPSPLLVEGSSRDLSATPDGVPLGPTPDLHSVFAREVTLNATPSHAILHLFTFTRYRLYVNGTYVGRGPCRYQNQRPEYDSRDITLFLHPGKNILTVLAHRDDPTGRIMRHDPGFIASLQIKNGTKMQIIDTDSSWLSTPERSFGSRSKAWGSIEEHIDARRGFDWTQPNLALPIWQPSVIVPGGGELTFYPRSSPLQSETERVWTSDAPVFPIDLVAGSELSLKLPEIVQAFHLVEMEAEEGSVLEVAYRLPHGDGSGNNTYAARSGLQTYMGGDTFAFRELRLSLKSGSIRLKRAAAFEVRYPFQLVASFASSDPFLNQLWEICARSLEVLSEDSYVDCSDRERVEWTDDSPPAFDCTKVMMRGPDEDGNAHWADARLLRGLLRRIALTQQADGQLKAHSCSERFDTHAIMEDRSCDWVVLLREYFESTGDTELTRELWPTLTRLLDWYRKRRTDRGLILAREWEVWDNPLRYEVCEGTGLNAMLYRALVDASILAASIGSRRDATAFAEEANRLQADFDQLLWNDQEGAYDSALFGPNSVIRPQMGQAFPGTITDGRFHPTAQANLFAIYSGIVPPQRQTSVRKWVLDHLQDIREPMSYYYLFKMLYGMEDNQQDSHVLTLMKAAWANQVNSDWQTTWEEIEDGGGSKIHIYGMHPGYFLTSYVLGARRDGPSKDRMILIEPRFSGLMWANGVCVTEFGPVAMDWKLNATGSPAIDCTLPSRVQARLRLRERGNSLLEVNGKPISARSVGGWIETRLEPGRNVIRFLPSN